MKRVLLISLLWFFDASMAHAASSGGSVTISVIYQSGVIQPKCTLTVTPNPNQAQVRVLGFVSRDGKEEASQSPDAKALVFKLKTKGAAEPTTLQRHDKPNSTELSGAPGNLGDLEGAAFVVRTSDGKDIVCQTSAAGTEAEPQACEGTLPALSKQVRDYLLDHPQASTHEEGNEGWRTGRVFVVAHKPNGETADTGTLPADISERDILRLVAIVPWSASVEFKIEECDAVPWYRLLHKEAAAAGAPQAVEIKIPEPPKTELRQVWYDQDLKCASKLKYAVKIAPTGCPTTTVEHTIETQPVYDLFLGAGFGFDAGEPASFSSQTRLKSDNTTEKVLVKIKDRTGFKSVITLSSFPFGWNLKRWRWWDTPAPFVAIDPSRLDKGAIAGINWTHSSGVGLLTGVSVFKTKELSAPVGLKPGSVVPNGVDVSTRDTFNSDSVGFFVGANFTTDVLQQFLKAAGGALGGGSEKGTSGSKGSGKDGSDGSQSQPGETK